MKSILNNTYENPKHMGAILEIGKMLQAIYFEKPCTAHKVESIWGFG